MKGTSGFRHVPESPALWSRRHDPATARKVLQAFTISVRTIDGFYRERRFVTGILGIPDAFLPDHREAGLADLRP